MKKGRVIKINLSNKMFYTLIAIAVLIFSGIVIYAYGSSNPTVMGHSHGEIEPCADGQVLQMVAGSWQCLNLPPGIVDTNAGTICGPGEYLDGDGNCVTEADIVPQGTICGMNQVGGTGLMSTCMGHNPASSCPPGYIRRVFGESGPNSYAHYSCYKT